MEWVLDPTHLSPNAGSFNNYILNAEEYYKGEVGLDKVGFKAIDKYTLQLTLKNPVPFFLSIASFMPVYRPFLEKHGILYGTELDKTIFIGPYVLTTFEPQYRRVYEKNPYYYNAKDVYIEKIIDTYNAESNLLGPELFLRGEVDYAGITSDILDMWMQNPATKDFVCPGKPDTTYQYYYMFNFWPQFDARFEPENWDLAVNNEAFRQSIFWGLDTYRAMLTQDPYTPEILLQSTITAVDFASVAGKDYVDFAPLKDFAHHPTWLFVPEKALAYKEQAMRELRAQGAKFPIKILLTYNPNVSSWPLEVQVVAQQLVELLGADYIEPVIEAGPSTNFLAEIRRGGKYAFLKGNNGAVAPEDPESWVYAFQPGLNWNFIDKGTGAETQATYATYVELVNKAKAITVKSEARYMAFAEAEAFLLSHAFVVPFCTDTDGYMVYRYDLFDGYGQAGFEGRKVLAEPMTGEQWKLLYADWQTGKQEALRNSTK
jgi:oligopeptide transport system substrate-binding protein